MKPFYLFLFPILFSLFLGPLSNIGSASSSSSEDEKDEGREPPQHVYGLLPDGSFTSNVPRFLELDKTKPYQTRAFLLFSLKNETNKPYPVGFYDVKAGGEIKVYFLLKKTVSNTSIDLDINLPQGFSGPKTVADALNAALVGRELSPIGEYETMESILNRLETKRKETI